MNPLFVTCALFLGLAIGQSHAQGPGKVSDKLKSEVQKLDPKNKSVMHAVKYSHDTPAWCPFIGLN
jgi:hypothetical protein